MDRRRLAPAGLAAGLLMAVAGSARAQLVTTMVDRDGLSLPCVTVGPLAPIAQEYCVRRTEKQGAVRKSQLGWSGLTVADDRQVAAVAPGSPGAQAGLRVGDRLVSVDGEPVRPPAGELARRLAFGPRGGVVTLALTRDGQPLERRFKRDAAPEPADAPHSPNPLVGVHPLMNWRGTYLPCMGAGLLGPAAVAACTSQGQHKGFVKTDELGDTGLTFDRSRPEVATIVAVAPGSAAAQADVRAGDVVAAIDGRRLDAVPANDAAPLLFGARGVSRRVLAERDGRPFTAEVVLAAPS